MDETVVSRDGPVEEAALRRRNSAIQDKEGEMNGAFWEHQEPEIQIGLHNKARLPPANQRQLFV